MANLISILFGIFLPFFAGIFFIINKYYIQPRMYPKPEPSIEKEATELQVQSELE